MAVGAIIMSTMVVASIVLRMITVRAMSGFRVRLVFFMLVVRV